MVGYRAAAACHRMLGSSPCKRQECHCHYSVPPNAQALKVWFPGDGAEGSVRLSQRWGLEGGIETTTVCPEGREHGNPGPLLCLPASCPLQERSFGLTLPDEFLLQQTMG